MQETLFRHVVDGKAGVSGLMRLGEFRRLCAGADGAAKEELRPPVAVEYIGRNSRAVLEGMQAAAEAARRYHRPNASQPPLCVVGDTSSDRRAGEHGGLEETLGQAAEGYTTFAQLKRVLSRHQTGARFRHS